MSGSGLQIANNSPPNSVNGSRNVVREKIILKTLVLSAGQIREENHSIAVDLRSLS